MGNKKHRGVYEHPKGSGLFWIQFFDQDRKRRRRKVGTFAQAVAAYQQAKTEVRQNKFRPEQFGLRPATFIAIADAAWLTLQASVSRRSYGARVLQRLKDWFGYTRPGAIRPEEIEARLQSLLDEGLAPATINRHRALLSVIFKHAMRNGRCECNPASLVRLRRENNARVRFLTDEEEDRLCAAIKELYPTRLPEFLLAVNTGMRKSEMYGSVADKVRVVEPLGWPSVDFAHGVLTIPRSKNGEARHIPINSDAREALLALRARGTALVCRGWEEDRTKDEEQLRWFPQCVRRANVPNFNWHDCRHTFASRLVMAGMDLRTVQELMGHKTLVMTQRYAHLSQPHLQEAVSRITRQSRRTASKTATSRKRRLRHPRSRIRKPFIYKG